MKKGLTELVFIIDRSGSMSGLEGDTIGGFNSMLKQQQAVDGKAVITTVLFDDQYELIHDRVDIQKVEPMTQETYTPRGSTALLDAIGKTIHNIRKAQKEAKEEDRAEKVIFFIITDGQENASRHYTASMIQERIRHQKQKHGWEFLFFGANMDAIAEAAKIGIADDRAQSYCADSAGTASVYTSMSTVSTAFRTGKQIQSMELTDEAQKETGSQFIKDALHNLKAVAGALKESADEMKDEFVGLFNAAKANGGKIPDVNEIAREVLSEKNERRNDQ